MKPRTVNTDTVRALQSAAARRVGVSLKRILSTDRHHSVVMARQAAMLVLRRSPMAPSYPDIGRAFGQRSALKSVRSAAIRERTDPWFAELVAWLEGYDPETQRRVTPVPPPKSLPYEPPAALPGVPCVTDGCTGRMVAPDLFPKGRRQCPACGRYEPRGMAARKRVA